MVTDQTMCELLMDISFPLSGVSSSVVGIGGGSGIGGSSVGIGSSSSGSGSS